MSTRIRVNMATMMDMSVRIEAVNAYRGEYMSAYSWASLTEAYMDHMNGNRKN